MSGYARAHRSRWDHPLFKNKQEAAVWSWMTDTARFRAHTFRTLFGTVTLERGQLLVSQRTIAEEFGLGRQQVRGLMSRMIAARMISENSTHSASRAGTIVTIINYERYQSDSGYDDDQATQGKPPRQPARNPRVTQEQPTREEREKREEGEEVVVGGGASDPFDHLHALVAKLGRAAGVVVAPSKYEHFAAQLDAARQWLAMGLDPDTEMIPALAQDVIDNPGNRHSLNYFTPLMGRIAARKDAIANGHTIDRSTRPTTHRQPDRASEMDIAVRKVLGGTG